VRKKLVWTITFLAGLFFLLEYVVPPEVGGGPDDHGATTPCLLRINDKYWMWYTGYSEPDQPAICIAESTDGIEWERGGRPVLKPGATLGCDYRGALSPCVILDGKTYKMWYVGLGYDKENTKPTAICYAESKDGVEWRKRGVVLRRGERGGWDDGGVVSPSVVKSDDGYLMWYVGVKGEFASVGMATSADGQHWRKLPKPVFGAGQAGWECLSISDVHVELIAVGNAFAMGYVGQASVALNEGGSERVMVGRVGAATSRDGRVWEGGHPILSPGDPRTSFDGLSIDSVATLMTPDISGVWYSARARGGLSGAAKRTPYPESGIQGRIGLAEWSPGVGAFVRIAGTGAGGAALDVGKPSVNTQLSRARDPVNDFIMVVAAFAFGMGLINLARVHGGSIARARVGTFEGFTTVVNSSVFFLVAAAMIVFKIWSESGGEMVVLTGPKPFAKAFHDVLFFDMYMPLGSTMFSLLSAYLVSAAYRSMRLKSIEAALLMISATIIMLGHVPIGLWLTHSDLVPFWLKIPTVSQWILFVANNAATRAMWFGVFVGTLAVSIRLWLGLERGTFFQKEL
jgi:predicted GH43/DUF377 family glycosyl hydrolase